MIKKIFKNTSGTSFPMTLAVVLGIFLLIGITFEYSRLLIVSNSVRNQLQEESTSVLQSNWSNVYSSLRDSYAGAYKCDYKTMKWDENVFVRNTFDQLGLVKEGNTYVKYVNNKKVYTLSDVRVNVKNSTFASRISENSLQIEIHARLNVPLTFGFQNLPGLSTTLVVRSQFIPKF